MFAKSTASLATLLAAIWMLESVMATEYSKAVMDKAIEGLNNYGDISARGEQAKTALTGKIKATLRFVTPYVPTSSSVTFAVTNAEVTKGDVKENAAAAAKIADMTVKIPLEKTESAGDHYVIKETTEVLPTKQGTATNVKAAKLTAVREDISSHCLKALKAAAEAAKKLAEKPLKNGVSHSLTPDAAQINAELDH